MSLSHPPKATNAASHGEPNWTSPAADEPSEVDGGGRSPADAEGGSEPNCRDEQATGAPRCAQDGATLERSRPGPPGQGVSARVGMSRTERRSSPAGRGYRQLVWQQFARSRLNRLALGVILCLVALALSADFIASDKPLVAHFEGRLFILPNLVAPSALRVYDNALLVKAMKPGDWALLPLVPYGYNTHDLNYVLSEPSSVHWLGTDQGGRDVLARVVHGARVSLAVGVMSVVVLVAVGLFFGTVAAYYGGWFDSLLMRVLEVVHSVPTLLLLVAMLAVLAPQGWSAVFAMMLVIGLIGWTGVARLVRGEILRVKTLDYVVASRAQGASDLRIILQHILPNSVSPVLVSATFSMASAILLESALSFLGFGIPDDMASWGGLLNGARSNVDAWWLAVFPGSAIFLTVTVYNVAGEGLRDAIDPRLKT